jgi:hypothetical protein
MAQRLGAALVEHLPVVAGIVICIYISLIAVAAVVARCTRMRSAEPLR